MEKLKYEFTGEDKQITELVDWHKEQNVPAIDRRNEYAKGNNPPILQRIIPEGSPDNKIPTSYARTLINLVCGYMYKPGLVTYASEQQEYLEALQEVFKHNKEPQATEQIGRQTSIQGVGYELFYNEGMDPVKAIDGSPGYKDVMPRFTKVPVASIIPIYSYDIEPQLTHFIRFYTNKQTQTEHIFVYDDRRMLSYERKLENSLLAPVGEAAHGFEMVPLVVYENNEDWIGDFSCVVPYIDAYDVLASDSMNEFDRFAWAYLIMKGFTLDDQEVDNLKHHRAITLFNEKDAIEFLTKDINHEFIKYMAEWFRGEIHRQTGIPNLDDYKFGANTSGETLGKWIYLMELFTDPKESYFKQALQRRIEIITSYKGLPGEPEDIEVIMSRNMPDKSMEQAELFNKYSGHISKKTLIENFADFVPDAEAELGQLKAEREEWAPLDLDALGDQRDEDEEDEEDRDKEE